MSPGPAISRPAADMISRSGEPDSSLQEISRASSVSFIDCFLKFAVAICHTSFSRTHWSRQSAAHALEPALSLIKSKNHQEKYRRMNERLSTQPGKKMLSEDYISAERKGSARQEYFNGQVIPKSGGNRWHNLIATSMATAIGTRLQGNRADVYVNGMRVQLSNRVICYPDVVVVA